MHVSSLFTDNARSTDAEASAGPTGPAWAYSSGPEPFRLLVVSTRAFAAGGVRDYDRGFGGALARGVTGWTAHGCEVEFAEVSDSTALGLPPTLNGLDVDFYDAVLVHVRDDEDPVRARAAVSALRARLSERSTVVCFVTGADAAASAVLQRDLEPSATVVVLPGSAAETRDGHRQRGSAVAEAVSAHLTVPQLWRRPVQPVDRAVQRVASADLKSLDIRWDSMFAQAVRFATAAYGAEIGAVGVLDGDALVYTASAGLESTVFERSQTLCDEVLDRPGGLLLGDARRDARFASRLPVADGLIRFYAGYRIRGPLGLPIATFCVSDPEPRTVRTQDLDLLRDMAHAAERSLWNTFMRRATVDPDEIVGASRS